MEKIQKKITFFIIFFFLFLAHSAQGASLYFSPHKGNYSAGNTFSVNVMISSNEQAMNAASGVIDFPADKLEVVSLNKTGSIFSLWVQEPTFSNITGFVNFEGIVLNPGFIGTGGKIFTINFKAKASGNAVVSFLSGAILANDGMGTNILTAMSSAQLALQSSRVAETPQVSQEIEKPKPASVLSGTPKPPIIFSITHPEPAKWYNNNKPKFTWEACAGIIAVKLLFDKNPNSQPTVLYNQPILEKQLDEVEDGVWYFHVQLKNEKGWGEIGHFKFQIDTKPPLPFKIAVVDGTETDNPSPTILFDAVDELSGMDYYKIKIGDSDFIPLSYEEKRKGNPYTLHIQTPGKKTILVQAYDKAGNYSIGTEEIFIKPLSSPAFTNWPSSLFAGETLIIEGVAVPNSNIVLWLQQDKEDAKQYSSKVKLNGEFAFSFKDIQHGHYTAWAQATDQRGAQSKLSEQISIVVKSPFIFNILSKAFQYISLMVGLIACLFVLLWLVVRGWQKAAFLKRILRKEVNEADVILQESFVQIKETLNEQLRILEKAKTKRDLTKEEEKMAKKISGVLNQAEKKIKKELSDINRKIK